MVRAVRLAATLGFEVEAATLAGIQAKAELVRAPLGRADRDRARQAAGAPSAVGRAAAARGHRAAGGDSTRRWRPSAACRRTRSRARTCGTTRCGPSTRRRPGRPVVRLAALVHDIGKPSTFADGHFLGHDAVGAELAGEFLDRLRSPRAVRERVVDLVANHMFSYEPNWSDAAVRRFIAKMRHRPGAIEDLFVLREADNVGSGLPAGRRAARRAAGAGPTRLRREGVVLGRGDLAVDGDDLMAELGHRAGAAPRAHPRRAAGAGRRGPGAQRPPDACCCSRSSMLADEPMIELLLQAERALDDGPGRRAPRRSTGRSRTPIRATRSRSSAWRA